MQNCGYSAPHHDAHPVDFHGKEGQIAGFFDSKIHGGFGDNTQFSGFDLGGARFRSVIPLILYSPFYKRALAQAKYYLVLFVRGYLQSVQTANLFNTLLQVGATGPIGTFPA